MASNFDDIQLTPETYDVLKLVPYEWSDEAVVVSGIVQQKIYSALDVRRRLDHLKKVGLVERRRRQTIAVQLEIRRIAKE